MASYRSPDRIKLTGVAAKASSSPHRTSTESGEQLIGTTSGPPNGSAAVGVLSTASSIEADGHTYNVDAVAPSSPAYMPSRHRCCPLEAWRNRSALERALLIALTLAICVWLVTLALFCLATRSSSTRSRHHPDGVCATSGCAKAAANILHAIDQSANPCDDFYQYACGQWNDNHPIPDDASTFGTFSDVTKRVLQQIRALLQTADSNEKSVAIKQSQIVYRACMNSARLRQLNSSLLHASYSRLPGGAWPLIAGEYGVDVGGRWRRETFDLTRLLADVAVSYGPALLVAVDIYADARNTSNNVIYIDQSRLGLNRGSRAYYLNDTLFGGVMRAYLTYMTRVTLTLVGDSRQTVTQNETAIKRGLLDVLQFEQQLAQIVVKETDRRNHTRMYNRRTVGDLNRLVPEIRWLDFFRFIAPDDMKDYVTASTPVVVCEIEYLLGISRLIRDTDTRLLANYLLWRITQRWAKNLDSRFNDIKQDFLRVFVGQKRRSPRWKECTPIPVKHLPFAVGSLYVKNHFKSKDKTEALEMINNLRTSFSGIINELDWMDLETKAVAIEKAHNMVNHIGYPDFILDPALLDAHYAGLEVADGDDYFSLMRRVARWRHMRDFRRLRRPVDRHEFRLSPALVNAFYSPEMNAITFPAGILQPPFFSGDYPKAINYGAIGAVIGHEMTHGFDDQGAQYDLRGNLHNWWTDAARRRFRTRTQCIVKQYGAYHVPDTNYTVNGELTQGENIADNGGVKEAYRAYRTYVGTLGREEPRLPGLLNFTNDQLFFLSYAQFWCEQKTAGAAVRQALTDEHSPERFRVVGVVSNLDAFAAAFRCPLGSRLNPAPSDHSKCDVW